MLKIINLKKHNSVSIQQEDEHYFITSGNGIVISIQTLAHIINYLVQNNIMSFKVLEGILEEYNTKGETYGNSPDR